MIGQLGRSLSRPLEGWVCWAVGVRVAFLFAVVLRAVGFVVGVWSRMCPCLCDGCLVVRLAFWWARATRLLEAEMIVLSVHDGGGLEG